MADIYLTKKERTTLYTEGLIYSIVIVLASYYTIYGSLFIKMIPMLFILGILGRCIFDKPKTTLILGSIAFFLTGLIAIQKIDLNLTLTTIYSAFLIALGLKTGGLLRSLYYSYKCRTFIGYNKKVIMIFALFTITILALFLNSIVNSNPIQYVMARYKTDRYIEKTYGEKKYTTNDVSYNIKNRGGYTFNVTIKGIEVTLVHKDLTAIEDTGLEARKQIKYIDENAKLESWKVLNNIDSKNNISIIYSYSKVALEPDIFEVVIKIKKQDFSDEQAISKAIEYIEKLKTFEDYGKISSVKLEIDNKSIHIPQEKISEGVTKEYIQKGFEVEYLD